MKKTLLIASAALALISCNMKNPLLTESTAPFGAPEFDKIENEHYLPAFEQGIAEAKAEIDAIVANQEEPSFENTIEAMEYAGQTLSKVASIFYAVMEAHTDDEKQQIAEQISMGQLDLSKLPIHSEVEIRGAIMPVVSATLERINRNLKDICEENGD